MKKLDTFQTHQLAIARKTLRLSCPGVRILGGPNHAEAIRIIAKLTGKRLDATSIKCCDCK